MKHPLLDGTYPFPEGDPKPESETPEAVHAQLARKGPNFRGRIRDVIKALRGENEKTVDRAVGHLIGCCKGEMIFRRVALKEIERLERTLSLAQTEIKGHMRNESDLLNELALARADWACAQARISELEKDAERYRWLRSQDWNTGPLFVVKQPTEVRLGTDCPSRDRLDAAIDAELKSRA